MRHCLALLIPAQQQIALDDQPPQIVGFPYENLVNRRFGGPVIAQHVRSQREPQSALGGCKPSINSSLKVDLRLICAQYLQRYNTYTKVIVFYRRIRELSRYDIKSNSIQSLRILGVRIKRLNIRPPCILSVILCARIGRRSYASFPSKE